MNRLPLEKRTQILGLLVEGNSLRAASRISGCSINTVTKLLVDVGTACADYQDKTFRNLACKRVQCDEIWSFVYARQKNVPEGMEDQAGDVWTWTALDADSRMIVSWMLGGRDLATAKAFINDLASRLANRIQLTTDGHRSYITAVEEGFGGDVDYSMLVKMYDQPKGKENERRYSPPVYKGTVRGTVSGNPDEKHVSTSYVERQNLTMRMGMRRFGRLTNAFSKKIENHMHAISLHFMYYNYGRIIKTLRVTPAMEARISDHIWSLEEIAGLVDSN